ncbi:MAG TPA: hypothetical protein VK212_07165 [Lentimicrobium sp.]|nr:hypothetical protein [Lentimicrobium sp.]
MKKSLLTAFIVAISACAIFAQVPKAFKYQAVIRDMNGIAIADQSINLRISIIPGNPDGEPCYSETHSAVTNGMGLVNLEIGRGTNQSKEFSAINWSQGEFYIRMEMDENGGSDFKPIGVSQLLSVPYALHSGTAESISGNERNGGDPGVPSYNWSLFGNSESNPPTDKLGTTDNKYLSVVTNNVERMKIWEGGDIDIWKSLTVGENATFNKTGGETDNYGPFTVSHLSPTLLSGTLEVDGATELNSSLDVYGITRLHSDFNVLEGAPSHLTGTLTVDSLAEFKQQVRMTDTINSHSVNTGTLVITGGTGIGRNLYVGGQTHLLGGLIIPDTTQSISLNATIKESDTTGALQVYGGTWIGRNLNVGGNASIRGTFNTYGQATFTSNPGSDEKNFGSYPLRVEGGSHGIAIKVNGNRSTDNNYVSFWDNESGGKMHGRIEGQTLSNLYGDKEFIVETALKSTDVALYLAESIIGALESLQGGFKVVAASTSTTACAGLGVCFTAPIPSLIIESSSNLVLKIANAVVFVANLGQKVTDLATYVAFKKEQIGVTYQSGAGDYAEWLPKEDLSANYLPGEIVGVRNGIVTKRLEGADKIMVVSTNPIVLGNMPPQGMENNYVKIAFMGQVPVNVLGNVKPGDYIIPSEIGSGFAKAVTPEMMQLKDYKNIVGVAWSDIVPITPGANLVNVAVGINTNDLANFIYKQEEKFNALQKEHEALKDEMAHTNSVLAELVPGYAEATGYKPDDYNAVKHVDYQPSGNLNLQENVAYSNPEDIIYFEFSREQVESSIDIARENYMEMLNSQEELTKVLVDNINMKMNSQGIVMMPIEEHPFWKRLDSDPKYKEEIINYIKDNLEKSFYTQRKYLDKFSEMKIKE